MSNEPFPPDENNFDFEMELDKKEKRKKGLFWLIFVGVVAGAGAGASFYFFSQGEPDGAQHEALYEPKEPPVTQEAPPHAVEPPPVSPVAPMPPIETPLPVEKDEHANEHVNVSHPVVGTEEKQQPSSAENQLVLLQPETNSEWTYDGTAQFPVFTWKSEGSATLVISRDPKVEKNIEIEYQTRDGKYEFRSVLPGQYYWKVASASGSSEIRSFVIHAAIKRKIALISPVEGGAISGERVDVSWSGDEKIRLYRVQYSVNPTLFDPQQDFQTVGTQMTLKLDQKGPVWIRVGAFSLVSEQWEYTEPVKIMVN